MAPDLGGDDDPDAASPAPDGGADLAAIPAGCVAERSGEDRPDDSGLDQIRVLYVTPSDGADAARDTSGQLCNSARAWATWFHEQSGLYLRLDTQDGLLDIGFVRLEASDEEMTGSDPGNTSVATGTAFVRNRIELALEQRGMIAGNKLYAVYYEGSSVYACGGGAYPPLIVDRVGAMYLGGQPAGQEMPCGDVRPWGQDSLVPNYIDYGMLHEVVHTAGFVPQAAPHQQSTGHVYDPAAAEPQRDLMYTPRDGSADPPWGIDSGLLLDLNSDDYYGAGGDPDLATSTLLSPLQPDAAPPIGW